MSFAIITLTIILCFISGCVAEECPVEGPPLTHLGFAYGTVNIFIFKNRQIHCAGWLSSWKFFANSAGSFYASVWRPHAGTYELIGKNRIDVQSQGVHEFHVPQSEQILVQRDDVIGHHAVSTGVSRAITGRFTTTSEAPPSGFTDDMYGPVIHWGGQNSGANLRMTVPPHATELIGDVALLPVLQIIENITSDTCILGAPPPVNLGVEAGTNNIHIYPNIRIGCNGRVSSWLFYAYSAGQFYASVWRRVGSTYTLIGKNRIYVTEEGTQRFDVEVSQQIVAMPGDVISEHAVDANTVRPLVFRNWHTTGFVPALFPDMMQSTYKWNARDDTISIGMTISVDENPQLIGPISTVALQPIITESVIEIYRTVTEYITVNNLTDIISMEPTTCKPIKIISPTSLPHNRFRLLIQQNGHISGDRCFVVSAKNTSCTDSKRMKFSIPIMDNSHKFAGRRKLCKTVKTSHIAATNTCYFLCHCEQFPCDAVLQINNILQPEVELCLVKSDYLCEEI